MSKLPYYHTRQSSADIFVMCHFLIFSVCVLQIFQAVSEVENLKSHMMTLFKELQQAQSKLDEAEGMKKNLQDRLGSYTRTPTLAL